MALFGCGSAHVAMVLGSAWVGVGSLFLYSALSIPSPLSELAHLLIQPTSMIEEFCPHAQ